MKDFFYFFQLHHNPDLAYIHFLGIDPLHTVKLGRFV